MKQASLLLLPLPFLKRGPTKLKPFSSSPYSPACVASWLRACCLLTTASEPPVRHAYVVRTCTTPTARQGKNFEFPAELLMINIPAYFENRRTCRQKRLTITEEWFYTVPRELHLRFSWNGPPKQWNVSMLRWTFKLVVAEPCKTRKEKSDRKCSAAISFEEFAEVRKESTQQATATMQCSLGFFLW